MPEFLFLDWKHTLLDKLKKRYDEVLKQGELERQWCAETRQMAVKFLKQFRKQYSIITGDKAKNTYCVICKRHLAQQIITEVDNTSTYEATQLTEVQITEEDYKFMLREKLVTMKLEEAQQILPPQNPPPEHTLFHSRIPTFGVSLKMHKANSLRFMAKSHKTSLSQLSKWLSRTFRETMLVSEEIWRELFLKAGIVTQSSWVINNSKQVRQRMAKMQAAGLRPPSSGQQTYDFATMYTSMQLKAIEKKMQQYVNLVFEYKRQDGGKDNGKPKVLMIKSRGLGKWITDENQKDKRGTKFMNAKKLKRWINYLLKRLYVKVGDQVKRQRIGLPMGTSCSPFLANIVLFMYEFLYFTDEIAKLKPWQLELDRETAKQKAKKSKQSWRVEVEKIMNEDGYNKGVSRLHMIRKLSFCTRYIDDLWNPLVEKDIFQSIVQRIYPPWLKLGLEDEGNVNYLDMTIWCEASKERDKIQWHSKLYDKKVGLIAAGLRLNKFPHPESCLSSRCKYGVITSQLHRYNVACTQTEHFLEPALDLYITYVEKGYKPQLINRYFSRFLRHYKPEVHSDIIRRRYAKQMGGQGRN